MDEFGRPGVTLGLASILSALVKPCILPRIRTWAYSSKLRGESYRRSILRQIRFASGSLHVRFIVMGVNENWNRLKQTLPQGIKKRGCAPLREPSPPKKGMEEGKSTPQTATQHPVKEAVSTQDILTLFPQARRPKDHGKYVALDCEMVGVGPEGLGHALARVSLVDYDGRVLLDSYVKPAERITDFRYEVTGITSTHLHKAPSLHQILPRLHPLLEGKVLIGHALRNDFRVLLLNHPKKKIRDTARYKPFHRLLQTTKPSLKRLTAEVLHFPIQTGTHDPTEDARAAMLLYRHVREEWERSLLKCPPTKEA